MKWMSLTLRRPGRWWPRRASRWFPRGVAVYRMRLRVGTMLELQFTPFRGISPLALYEDWSTVAPAVQIWSLKELWMKKKNPVSQSADGPEHLAAVESELFSKLHPLVAHCAVVRYEDGDARKPGWITIKTLGSAWVVQVKDPDSAASFQATAASLDDALALASLMLEADQTPWEPDPWLLSQQKAKKK